MEAYLSIMNVNLPKTYLVATSAQFIDFPFWFSQGLIC